MKIALIELEEGLGEPRLGLAYLASYIKKYSEFDNNFLILNGRMNILKELEKFKPDLIGMSAVSHDFWKVNDFALKLKKFNVPIIVGGVHITTMSEDFNESNFDIAIIGEGEKTFLELCDLINKDKFNNKELMGVKGIVFRDKKKIIRTNPRELIKDLDDIPFPARDLLNIGEYWLNAPVRGEKRLSIITSRGCPYNCAFCSSAHFWQKYRFHSAEYVVKEIKKVYSEYNLKIIVFSDDLFIANKNRIKEIIALLEKEKLLGKIKFHVTGRANLIDEEICQLLKKLNVYSVDFGLESGSEKILKYLKGENVSVEQNYNALKLCKKYGIGTCGFIVIGTPYETESDLKKTEKLMKCEYLDQVMIYQLLPYPGTKIWDYAIRKKKIKKDFFKRNINYSGFRKELVLTEKISEERFKFWWDRLMDVAELKNYKLNSFGLKEIRNILFTKTGLKKLIKYKNKIPFEIYKLFKYKLKPKISSLK